MTKPDQALASLPLPDLLLRQGSMTGPYRPIRPMTVTLRQRLLRAVRSMLNHINQRKDFQP